MKLLTGQPMGKYDYPSGRIFKIKRFSVHDGPGIRTAVFLKGCPLSCIWCHSPEGISSEITIWYNGNICIFCESCVDSCPNLALEMKEAGERYIHIDREKCRLSGNCANVCPSGAISFTGTEVRVQDIITEIEKDNIFYEVSGGGVTFSGGEPLLQPEFLSGLLDECNTRKIHTAIETSLFAELETIDLIIDKTDLFIVDLKLSDQDLHNHYTGKSNERILKNFKYIAGYGKELIVRIPLIKDITDTESNLDAIESFVKELNDKIPIEKIKYNSLAENNYKRLGIPFLLK
jgi:pyruvate formate lyase activating enzyme